MKFITIWENIFNDFFEELQSPRKLDSSVFFVQAMAGMIFGPRLEM